MADLQSNIDKVSAAFARAVEAGRVRIVDNLIGLVERGATTEELIRALQASTVDDLLRGSGLSGAVGEMGEAYATQVLAGMVQFAPVSDAVLAALVQADQANYLQLMRTEITGLVRAVQQAVLSGGGAREIRAAALGAGQTRAQVEALVNTSLNTFSRTVTAIQAEAAPPESLYIYAGPVDGRTRDLCLRMSAAGELTKADIDRAFPGAFRDGGGFNCRHQWLPTGTVTQAKRGESAAQQAIADRGDKWKEPLTVAEQIGRREG